MISNKQALSLVSCCIFLCSGLKALAISTEEIAFKSGELTLSGSILKPAGEGIFPAIIFLHGSGPETRENSLRRAKRFAKNGYLALIYDKRDAGKSGGSKADWSYFSFDSLAQDALAAVHYLKQRKDVQTKKIGLHAASQSGWVASIVAANSKDIAFMIVLSASVSTLAEDRLFERAARLKREGFSPKALAEAKEMQILEPKTTIADEAADEFTRLFEKNREKTWFSRVYPTGGPFSEFMIKYRKWYATIADFDPIPYLEKIEIPVLWIFGDPSLDRQGPVELSISNLEKLKQKGKDYAIFQFAGEGHNVKEKKYKSPLNNWLSALAINN